MAKERLSKKVLDGMDIMSRAAQKSAKRNPTGIMHTIGTNAIEHHKRMKRQMKKSGVDKLTKQAKKT